MRKLTPAQVRLILVICSLLVFTLFEIYIFWNIKVDFENTFVGLSFYILLLLYSTALKSEIVSSCDYLADKITDSMY